QLTVAAWMNVQASIPDYSTAISRQMGNALEQHYHLSINSGYQAILFVNPVGGKVVLGSPNNAPLPQQTWIHLAGTYDGSGARFSLGGHVGGREADASLAAAGLDEDAGFQDRAQLLVRLGPGGPVVGDGDRPAAPLRGPHAVDLVPAADVAAAVAAGAGRAP